MNKLFDILRKPSKWIFIICGAIIGVAYAVVHAQSIKGGMGFLPLVSELIIMIVGTLLLLAAPVLLLLKKEEGAKMVFFFLLGFWLLRYIQDGLRLSSYANSNEAMLKVGGVFAFIVGLCLTAVLVLTVLEFGLKKEGLRRFSVLVLFVAIVLGLLASLFFFIAACGKKIDWNGALSNILTVCGYSFAVFFGYLYFFNAPKAE